jgi:ketosteroid isomerase-like protein
MKATSALTICLTGAAVALAAAAHAQAPPADQELARLETVWNDAHVRGDAAPLERIAADDLVVIVPAMPVMSGTDAFAVLRSGRMRFDRYDTSEIRIRLYDKAAIVTGRLQRTRTMNGQPVNDDWRFTKVYIGASGQWRLASFHASPRS